MRKLKQKLAAIGMGLAVMAMAATSLTASAADWEAWGPHFYTPYEGRFSASTTRVYVNGLRWTQGQIDQIKSYLGTRTIEFEFRPGDGTKEGKVDPHTIWSSGVGTLNSNLPDYHFEFQGTDHDDIAICCLDAKSLVAGTYYYGIMQMQPVSNPPSPQQYIFESEFGTRIPFTDESWPDRYEQYTQRLTYIGSTEYTWS